VAEQDTTDEIMQLVNNLETVPDVSALVALMCKRKGGG